MQTSTTNQLKNLLVVKNRKNVFTPLGIVALDAVLYVLVNALDKSPVAYYLLEVLSSLLLMLAVHWYSDYLDSQGKVCCVAVPLQAVLLFTLLFEASLVLYYLHTPVLSYQAISSFLWDQSGASNVVYVYYTLLSLFVINQLYMTGVLALVSKAFKQRLRLNSND